MNQLNISTGGHPVFNEDVLLVQSAMLDGFNALFQQIADTNALTCFVISGCVASVSSGILSVTEGYLYFNGEMLKFTATSLAYNPINYYYFDLQVINTLPRVYKNTVTNSPNQVRTAIISALPSPTASLQDVFSALKYENLIQLKSLNSVNNIESAWTKLSTGFTIIPTYIGVGTYNILSTKLAYKVVGKTIHCTLSIAIETTLTTSIITHIAVTLPISVGISFANFMPQQVVFKWDTSASREYCACAAIAATHQLIFQRDQSATYPAGSSIFLLGQFAFEIA